MVFIMKAEFLLAAMLLMLPVLAFAQDAVPSPFQPLKDLSAMAGDFDLVTKSIVFLISLAIFAIALLAYNRSKSRRLLLVSLAFFLFTAKWALKIIDMVMSPGTFLSDASENIFELGILLLLFVAIFKK